MSPARRMPSFREEVEGDIGGALREIGATFIKHTLTGEGWRETNVCFYSASNKIIAIDHIPREGFACFIGDASSAELSQYETWPTLWRRLGMDKNIDIETDEGLNEFIRMFPDDQTEYMKFMGTCLVKYFGRVR